MRGGLRAAGVWALLLRLAAAQADEVVLPAVSVRAMAPGASTNVPASVTEVSVDPDGRAAGLAESLQAVPGVSARDRENFAQDAQISVRGFGTRSSFGLRGVRLTVDGIPATQPDGQGQISQFFLANGGTVDVLRGPFAVLLGNAPGGAIVFTTPAPPQAPAFDLSAGLATGGEHRLAAVIGGGDVSAGFSDFVTPGERPHSAAQRRLASGKAERRWGDARLTLVANHLDAPDAQDPLGLTPAQFAANPYQTAQAAFDYDTRKSLRQDQLGAVLDLPMAGGTLRGMVYAGTRAVEQYLAIPPSAQSNPQHAGGVVDLQTRFAGGDWRYSRPLGPVSLSLGIALDGLEQHRLGFENFADGAVGQRGNLRRDEINTAVAIDPYAEASWAVSPRWRLTGGVRQSRVSIESDDRYQRPGNGDDSGRVQYRALSPAVGLLFKPSPALAWHAAWGKGFETPTLAELAYRPGDTGGFNDRLRAATTHSAELGLRWKPRAGAQLAAALFRADTDDELVVLANSGGRASYGNAASTRRQGAELEAEWPLTESLRLLASATWLDARNRAAYLGCDRTPCTTPDAVVAAGTRIAAVARTEAFAALRYERARWAVQGHIHKRSALTANDQATVSAPASTLVGATMARDVGALAAGLARLSLSVDNLFDRANVASVIVNDGNGRYFEPGRGRTVMLALSLHWQPPTP